MCVDDKNEFPSPLIIGLFTETIGTFIMMFIGCMGCLFQYGIGPVIPSFAFAFAILAALQMLHADGPVHLNPGVSIAFLIVQKMSWKRFLVYVVAQYIGCFLGWITLYVVAPDESQNICLLRLKWELSPIQGFVIEMLGATVLIWIVLGAIDAKNSALKDSLPVRIALGVCGIIFALEPLTGAGLNSARSFPPAAYYNNWKDHWLYELAPICGTSIGAVIYRFILDDEDKYSLHSYLKKAEEGGEA
ncbi:aquaporin-like [Diorhabda carinulata]|uniref:aquaporin-like n=1 Tax=Diorhabda carinulata TaxID=1163345 RepID=UPI0025A192A2|nr:aquaporin-like [Diorhabda carinulata]